MKKSVILSLLFLSLNGLYAMEAESGSKERFPFEELPEELREIIMCNPRDVAMSLEHEIPIVGEYSADSDHAGCSLCFSPDGGKLASAGKNGGVTIADLSSGMVQEFNVYKKICLPRVGWSADNRSVVSFLPHKEGIDEAAWDIRTIEVEGDGEKNRELVAVGSWIGFPQQSFDGFYMKLTDNVDWNKKRDRSTWELTKKDDEKQGISLWRGCDFGIHCWSPDGSMLAFWNEDKIRIVNMLSPLLALFQHECRTWDQILLLGKLQEMLRKEEPSLIIGAEDRSMLEGMGGVKNWFIIKEATGKPLWLLTPRRYTEEVKVWKEGLLHRLAGTKRKRRDLLSATLPPLAAGALAWFAVRYLQAVGS